MTISYRSVKGSDLTPAEVDANIADLAARTPASQANAASSKTTPVDADELPLGDSVASFGLKKLTWSNLKATLKTYFDGLYAALAGSASQAFSTAALTVAGLLDISGAAAGQIKFPATQNASSNANTLDDYEEGTWTPIDQSGGGLSLTVDHAYYTKVGRVVHFQCYITYPVNSDNTYVATLGGLPFASAKTMSADAWGNLSDLTAKLNAGGTYIYLILGGTTVYNSSFSGKTISVCATYTI